MKKVLTVGGATQDIFIAPDQLQMFYLCLQEGKRSFLVYEAGAKIEVSNLVYHTGGGATNTAAAFRNFNFDVALFSKLGTDPVADFILKSLHARGIDTHYVIKDSAAPTATSFILPTESGDRVTFVYRGAGLTITEGELPFDAFNTIDLLYVATLGGSSSAVLLPLVKEAKKQKILVAVNPGSIQLAVGADVLRESLPYIDILVLNNVEARRCMASLVQQDYSLQLKMVSLLNRQEAKEHLPQLLRSSRAANGSCFNLPFFFREILSKGPQYVVVTNGKEGVYVATNNGILFHPSIPAKVISCLGAGDAFAATFVGWLLNENSVENAVRAGVINSASVIGHLGAKTGLLTQDELERRLQQIDLSLLQQFPIDND